MESPPAGPERFVYNWDLRRVPLRVWQPPTLVCTGVKYSDWLKRSRWKLANNIISSTCNKITKKRHCARIHERSLVEAETRFFPAAVHQSRIVDSSKNFFVMGRACQALCVHRSVKVNAHTQENEGLFAWTWTLWFRLSGGVYLWEFYEYREVHGTLRTRHSAWNNPENCFVTWEKGTGGWEQLRRSPVLTIEANKMHGKFIYGTFGCSGVKLHMRRRSADPVFLFQTPLILYLALYDTDVCIINFASSKENSTNRKFGHLHRACFPSKKFVCRCLGRYLNLIMLIWHPILFRSYEPFEWSLPTLGTSLWQISCTSSCHIW